MALATAAQLEVRPPTKIPAAAMAGSRITWAEQRNYWLGGIRVQPARRRLGPRCRPMAGARKGPKASSMNTGGVNGRKKKKKRGPVIRTGD